MDTVAYVLARAVEEGAAFAIQPAAHRFDPLLRGSIAKRARDAIAVASTKTKVQDEKHHLRLAFLSVTSTTVAPDDVIAVEAAFEIERASYPKLGRWAIWPVTHSAIVVVLVSVIAVGAFVLWPSPRERFAKSALGTGMSVGLTDFVVGSSNHNSTREQKGRDALLSAGVKRQICDEAFADLEKMLTQTIATSRAPTETDFLREREALEKATRALNLALATKRLPAFFDTYTESEVFGAAAWLMGYYVTDRATITFGGAPFPVVWGRRTDNLNLEVGGKVYESTALGGLVVSIDDIEQWSIRIVIPALAKGASFQQGEEAGRFAAKAGEKIRAELLPIGDLSADDADDMASLFVQRHAAFGRLALLGDELYEPRGLRLSPKLKDVIGRRSDEVDAKEILRLEDRLARMEPAFDRLTAAQAKLDEIRVAASVSCIKLACKLTLDDELAATLKTVELSVSESAAIAGRLATIARSDNATELAFAEAQIGIGGYLTIFLVERELGLSPGWVNRGGIGDTGEYNQLGSGALDRTPAELRNAAIAAYGKVFHTPMPAFVRATAP
ncbi:hypothetical protein BH09MYX1_BH09MYX1_27350 [soil metagenome]